MVLKYLASYLSIMLMIKFGASETPKFRILAPEFICPKDENTPIEKPDNTVITLQTTASSTFNITWTVRWASIDAPTQRFTLMLWKTVRALEKMLNGRPAEPYVYVIPNDELLNGVKYIFNVSAVEPDGTISSPKSFHIDNTQGDQKLGFIEGRGDLMYVMLAGAQETYANAEFIVEALITTCFPTQDYHFLWTIHRTEDHEIVYIPPINSSRLIVPPYTLTAGQDYDVNCQVIKHSTGAKITQTGLPFQVLHRRLSVSLSFDYLMVPANQPFYVEPKVINNDFYDTPVYFDWKCSNLGQQCKLFESVDNDTLYFSSGLSELGDYEIKVTVTVMDQTADASATITVVKHNLPVVQITTLSHIQNEGSKVNLVANATNVAPTCTLTWYFATESFLINNKDKNNTCSDCKHGEALSDTLTIFSLEENFLNELVDFTNQTEWRQVSGEMVAKAGRARLLAKCGCSITFECETEGIVYADKSFIINKSPKPERVKLSPEAGTAMETVFRISTTSALDADIPIQYSFYCRVGDEDILMLGSFVDHLALETLLPYVGGGTDIWVEVCDSYGACASGEVTTIVLSPGEGTTVDTLIDEVKGRLRRCELQQLLALAGSAIVTYTNANQPTQLSKFTSALLTSLPPELQCLEHQRHQYTSFLHWLGNHSIDVGEFSN